ncbi:Por secretion system C-terminal sorting domain-containing protein [Cyclobacterium lianum]|uniref:Por secretion system C-terminal sorting domain-containing protein n=2 Tax=Cyclobacterium lianum TaxID=388280 RepID=A0A1M7IMD9_9BACT|nr:Por secretion system C-terminal sorting domain-containing protein [Cyclobacterium lianum]
MYLFSRLFITRNLVIALMLLSEGYFCAVHSHQTFAHHQQEGVPGNLLGDELWTAGHESGDQREWSQDGGGGEFNTGSGNSTVSSELSHTGNYSLKMSINTSRGEGHGTRNYRWAELGNHEDLIFTQYFYFPARIDLDEKNAWFNLIQTKSVKFAPGGAGTGEDQINDPHFVLGLKVRGGAGSGGANFLVMSDLQEFHVNQSGAFWQAPAGMDLPVNKWVKIQMRIIQDHGDRGRILVWQDDHLIIDTGPRNTLRPEVDQNMFSINAYADKTFPALTNFYVDDVSIHLPGTQPIPVEDLLPSVSIIAPDNNSIVRSDSEVEIQAEVSSADSQIVKVEYYNDTELIGTSTTPPYAIKWIQPVSGSYTIKAVATDERNRVGNSEGITLHVAAVLSDVPEEEGTGNEDTEVSTPGKDYRDYTPSLFANRDMHIGFSPASNAFADVHIASLLPQDAGKQHRVNQDLRFSTESIVPALLLELPVETALYKVFTFNSQPDFGNFAPLMIKGRKIIGVEKDRELVKENSKTSARVGPGGGKLHTSAAGALEGQGPPRLYPNPAWEYFIVDVGNEGDHYHYFLIHDMQGRLVHQYFPTQLSRENGHFIVPISGVRQGMYQISLIDKYNGADRFRLLLSPQ